MVVTIETRSVCDVCGAETIEPGRHGNRAAVGWAELTLQWRVEPTRDKPG